jgi:hypothetical protein
MAQAFTLLSCQWQLSLMAAGCYCLRLHTRVRCWICNHGEQEVCWAVHGFLLAAGHAVHLRVQCLLWWGSRLSGHTSDLQAGLQRRGANQRRSASQIVCMSKGHLWHQVQWLSLRSGSTL